MELCQDLEKQFQNYFSTDQEETFALDFENLTSFQEISTVKKSISIPDSGCTSCGSVCYNTETSRICSKCGLEEELSGVNIENVCCLSRNSYNTNSSSATPIKITGPKGYYYSRRLMSRTTDYGKTQFRDTITQMMNITQRFQGKRVSPALVREAANLYHQIQQLGEIKRGDVRRGTMCACLYRICDKSGVSRKRSLLCNMFEIRSSDLSNGEKTVDRLCSENKLAITPMKYNTGDAEKIKIRGFLNDYFITMKLPMDYFDFANKLVWFTIKFRISSSSNPSSKAAGSIWVLITHNKLNYTAKQLEKTCEISASTFKRYSKCIDEFLYSKKYEMRGLRRKMRHLFNKYAVLV